MKISGTLDLTPEARTAHSETVVLRGDTWILTDVSENTDCWLEASADGAAWHRVLGLGPSGFGGPPDSYIGQGRTAVPFRLPTTANMDLAFRLAANLRGTAAGTVTFTIGD